MELFATSALISGLTALLFGAYIYFKSNKDLPALLFLLLSFSTGLWGVSYWYWLYTGTNYDIADFYVRILSIFATMSVAFFVHWVSLVNKLESPLFKYLVIAPTYLLVMVSIPIFFFTDLLVGNLKSNIITPYWPEAGQLHIYYLATIFILPLIVTSVLLIRLLVDKKIKPDQKRRVKVLLAGMFFGFGGAGTNFFLWYDINILPYGNFLMLLYPPLVSYSAVKHKLFDVRTIAVDITVFFLVLSALFQMIIVQNGIMLLWQFLFFIVVLAVSYILTKTFRSELKHKREIERLVGQLEETNKHLEDISQKKSEFLSIATHQLRAPVAVMKGQLSLILEGAYGQVPSKIKSPLKKVFLSSERMAHTITDFLNVSRIEQGRMEYNFTMVNLLDLTKSVYDELKGLAKEKGVKLTFNKDKSVKSELYIHADKDKIRHVIFNLVENALKYTKEGEVKVSLRITKYDRVQIAIHDSGVGIDKKDIAILFDKFVRAKNIYGINVEGTGLGLYIAREIVYRHNGRIWAESEGLGKGATFFLEFTVLKNGPKSKKA